jgi:hypothetical protein
MKKAAIAVMSFLMIATLAVADGHGGPGGQGGPGGAGLPGHDGGGRLNVAADGTVIVVRATAASTASNPAAEIVAIRNGAVAWTAALPSVRTDVEISGAEVIEITDTTASGATTPTTKLTALSTTNGAQSWTLNVNGRVTDVTPYSGGTYAVVIVPAATTGGTASRTLISINTSGVITSSVAF